MTKMLLTGSAGFIGSLVACELLGLELVCVDSFNSWYYTRFEQFRVDGLKKRFSRFLKVLPVNNSFSPYAASKKSAEMVCNTNHRLFRIDVSIPPFSTVYGPMGRPDMSYFQFMEVIAEGAPITLYGDGIRGRNFTYLTDIAHGVHAALTPAGCEAIDLGGGQNPIPVNKIVSILEEQLLKTG